MPRKKLKTAAEALVELFADDDSGDDDIPCERMDVSDESDSDSEQIIVENDLVSLLHLFLF